MNGETEARGRAVTGLRSRLSWCRTKAGVLSWLPVSSLHLPAGARGSALGFGFPRRRRQDRSWSASLYLGGAAPTGGQGENGAGREAREGVSASLSPRLPPVAAGSSTRRGAWEAEWSSRPERARPGAPVRSLPLGLVKGCSWGASPLHPRPSTQRIPRAGSRSWHSGAGAL